jgi:hypothetical protein
MRTNDRSQTGRRIAPAQSPAASGILDHLPLCSRCCYVTKHLLASWTLSSANAANALSRSTHFPSICQSQPNNRQRNTSNDDQDVINRCHAKCVSCRLTSRTQARRADDVLRDSGTGDAIPRCLQRFVRLLCISYLEMPSSVKTICPTTVWQSTEDLQPTSALVALPIPPAKHAMREYLWWLLRTAPRLNLLAQNNANVWQTFRLYSC